MRLLFCKRADENLLGRITDLFAVTAVSISKLGILLFSSFSQLRCDLRNNADTILPFGCCSYPHREGGETMDYRARTNQIPASIVGADFATVL